MIVDHTGAAFFPQCLEMRLLGRIAFPLYAWCLAVGAEYTRNIWKYALRLLIVGVISQPVYVFAMRHQWMEWNIFATLLLGLLGVAGVVCGQRFGLKLGGKLNAVQLRRLVYAYVILSGAVTVVQHL